MYSISGGLFRLMLLVLVAIPPVAAHLFDVSWASAFIGTVLVLAFFLVPA